MNKKTPKVTGIGGIFFRSQNPEKARESARELMLSDNRSYGTYAEMVEAESKLPPGERIDFVSIVTPNKMHFPVAKVFAGAGINITASHNPPEYNGIKLCRQGAAPVGLDTGLQEIRVGRRHRIGRFPGEGHDL